jgi:hypothetical protein
VKFAGVDHKKWQPSRQVTLQRDAREKSYFGSAVWAVIEPASEALCAGLFSFPGTPGDSRFNVPLCSSDVQQCLFQYADFLIAD